MISVSNATPDDFAAILALQLLNHGENLAENERGDGFLTTRLTLAGLEERAAHNGVVVVRAGIELAGFACAEEWDLSEPHLFHQAVFGLFPLQLGNSLIESHNSFQYGPVCVARRFRGRGVLPLLFDAIRFNFRERYEWGVTFVDHCNGRSFAAHTRKLGLQMLTDLPYDTTIYHVLGFSTRPIQSLT